MKKVNSFWINSHQDIKVELCSHIFAKRDGFSDHLLSLAGVVLAAGPDQNLLSLGRDGVVVVVQRRTNLAQPDGDRVGSSVVAEVQVDDSLKNRANCRLNHIAHTSGGARVNIFVR